MSKRELSPEALAFRAGMKTWATSLRLLLKAAQEEGADPEKVVSKALIEYGRGVSKGYGAIHGADEFVGKMVGGIGQQGYDVTIEEADKERAVLNIHNCPLVEQWKAENLPPEEIELLCHYSCYGDLGKISRYPELSLAFPQTQGKGDELCELVFTYKEG